MCYTGNYRRRRNICDALLDWIDRHPAVGWSVSAMTYAAIGVMLAACAGGVR